MQATSIPHLDLILQPTSWRSRFHYLYSPLFTQKTDRSSKKKKSWINWSNCFKPSDVLALAYKVLHNLVPAHTSSLTLLPLCLPLLSSNHNHTGILSCAWTQQALPTSGLCTCDVRSKIFPWLYFVCWLVCFIFCLSGLSSNVISSEKCHSKWVPLSLSVISSLLFLIVFVIMWHYLISDLLTVSFFSVNKVTRLEIHPFDLLLYFSASNSAWQTLETWAT